MEMMLAAPPDTETRTLVAEEGPQADLPPGRTWTCLACGTRLRTGQPHTASQPWPHGALNALAGGAA